MSESGVSVELKYSYVIGADMYLSIKLRHFLYSLTSNHKPSYKSGNSFPFIHAAFCMCRDLKISAAFRLEQAG